MLKFRDAVALVVELAEMENSVFRLAREVKRTQRRVNALEKIFLPRYEQALKYIGGALEEREREELVVVRRIRQLRGAAL
jgi:V/A-type H+-transporting ATPase subunit D